MNLVARQVYGNKKGLGGTNTEIGGVASTISTPALLASKLAIDVSRITNFSIVGSDIKCKITGSYGIPSGAHVFGFQSSSKPTYYIDSDFLINAVGDNCFYAGNLNQDIDFKNALTVGSGAFTFYGNKIFLKNATSLGNSCFYGATNMEVIYIPNATTLGTALTAQDSDNERVFLMADTDFRNLKIYAHPSLATINAGGLEGDLSDAQSRGAVIRFVTNFTAPNPLATLSAGTIYNSAIQLNFTPSTGSANAIDFYECYVDGVFKSRITASGQYITGLNTSTSYNITVVAVDIFYNKSVVSNSVTATTTNYVYDADAIAVNTASGLVSESAKEANHILISQSKTNGLWAKYKAVYLFKGTNALSHKINAKNPVDTNAGFRLVFSGGGTFSELGYQGNGSNAWADTYFAPSSNLTVNSNGITIVSGTNNNVAGTDAVEAGTFQNGSQAYFCSVKRKNSPQRIDAVLNSTSNVLIVNDSDAKGIITGSKTASNLHKLFKNGTLIGTGVGGGTLPTSTCNIGRLDSVNGQYSRQRIQMVLFHEGLSDAEVSMMHSTIDLSESIAGRKTW